MICARFYLSDIQTNAKERNALKRDFQENNYGKENQLIIQLRGFDAKHYTRTERYAKQVAKLYQTAADEFASLAGKINLPAGGTFNFDDFPKAKKQARGIVTRLAGKIEAVVTSGQRSEWLAACQKNDAF